MIIDLAVSFVLKLFTFFNVAIFKKKYNKAINHSKDKPMNCFFKNNSYLLTKNNVRLNTKRELYQRQTFYVHFIHKKETSICVRLIES